MAETDLYTQEKTAGPVELVVKAVERAERDYHDAFIQKVEARYAAYRGLSDQPQSSSSSDEEDWHSEVTTPYVLQTCEGMLATMLEPNPRFNVQPRPKPDEPLDEILRRIVEVDAIEDLIRYAMERDHFAERQRDFMQQDMIAGISVLKDYWTTEHRDITQLVPEQIDIEDEYGNVVESITTHKEEVTKGAIYRDDACCEVVDVRDFFWPGQAPNVDKAEWLVHRTWETLASLKRKEKDGYLRNVSKLQEAETSQKNSEITKREMRLRNLDRTQYLHEVLEYWTPERVITVGDRTVLLRDRPNPLWNGRSPFIVCASMPDAFQIPGFSVVEALAQLQEMLWTLQNQRLDVVRMLANLITLIRSDVDDPEAFEWAPNAQWFVEDPGQVATLDVNPQAATITIQAEEMLKGDLQNIMGGLPYASGADSTTIDQQTATGVSIITTIAQRIIQARKQHYLWAFAKLGKNFLLLYQQFLRDDRVVKVLGVNGAAAYKQVSPLDIQGDFDVMIDVTSDSLMRQERRAEANSLLQIAGTLAPIMAQLGTPLNMKAFMDKTLDAYDILDKERYYLPPQAAPAAAMSLQGQQQNGGQPTGPPALPSPTNGLTNVPAAAGPTSPSNVNSLSPEAAMQRLMATRGGPANA